jgi:hypothetical protein
MNESDLVPKKDLIPPYQPTLPERAVLAMHRKKDQAPVPRMRMSVCEGVAQIGIEHPKPTVARILLMEALGTLDPDFLDGLLLQLSDAEIPGQTAEGRGLNFMLAISHGGARDGQ